MAGHSILILSNRVPFPLNDGGSLAMYRMIEGYFKAGWDVFLFSMNTSRHFVPPDTLPPLFRQIRLETFDINTDVKVVPTVKNFLLSRKPNHADRFYSKDFETRLRQIIASFKPDIIQLESIYLASYIDTVRQACNAHLAIRLHNIEFQIWERLSEETSTGFRKFYLRDLAARIRRFEMDAWERADILLPITGVDANLVKQHVPEAEIMVVPYGFEISQTSAGMNGVWSAYHLGAMDWVPNAEAVSWFIEEVWPGVHEQKPGFHFYFAGRNMPYSFQKYNGNGVTCMGEVADAAEFIADKNILVVPLRSGGGVRIKILEAMAAGKLVISTAVGMQGIDEAIPGKHYLQADTVNEFREKLLWCLDNQTEAASVAQSGAVMVREGYDETKIMNSLVKQMSAFITQKETAARKTRR
ncbi:MAG: glycosyltransferase [Sphingobacteriales bacterium]|nr:MAG: glycosyltransferase [Sphingobacteriales bacterium]